MALGSESINSLRQTLAADPRWLLVQRVAGSGYFQRSTRLRDFLLYVCECALTERPEQVREQQIGTIVFGRRADYNPSEDNIVRVEARELRKRLERYFQEEGANEALEIKIPKGSYLPIFETRAVNPDRVGTSAVEATSTQPPAPASDPTPAVVETAVPAQGSPTGRHVERGRWMTVVLWALLLTGAALAGAFWQSRASHVTGTDRDTALTGVWPLLLNGHHPTYIVVADSSLVLSEDLSHRRSTLEQYSARSAPGNQDGFDSRLILSRQYTSLADVTITARILQALGSNSSRLGLLYARNLATRDLSNNNLIFLGSSYSNPWISEFDQQRNFLFEIDEKLQRPYYLNRFPRDGEQPRYYAAGPDSKNGDTYGVVALLPNLSHDGAVLIIEGTTSEGTEAAGDFVTDPQFAPLLRQDLGLTDPHQPLPYFELLLKTSTIAGAPTKVNYVAHRVLPPDLR